MDDMRENQPDIKMSYRIEGSYSPYKFIEVAVSGTGQGRLSYALYREFTEKEETTEVTIPFSVHPSTIEELINLHEEVNFFNLPVKDLNKEEITVTDVGTTTLTFRYKGKERKISYGYMENDPLTKLVTFYGRIIKEHLPKENAR